jgi:uncharacterized protein GlcG (DUF336 family)
VSLIGAATLGMASASVFAVTENQAGSTNDCSELPTYAELTTALETAVAATNGGLDFDMWGTVVNRFGVVCAVTAAHAISGSGTAGDPDPWAGSRVISAQKANTANAFSTDGLPLSTAQIYSAVQPGGSLYGLQHSNPVDTRVGYLGDPKTYGTASDPMVGLKPGGINVFGGGLPLYNASGDLVGAVGVSGDTSCSDHNIAWKTREALTGLTSANTPGGLGSPKDNIIYDISGGVSASGWGHPSCGAAAEAIAAGF